VINTATLMIVPSRYREPFALVAVEAAQMARPVVATRTGGLEETVAHGESGLLVEHESPGALADAIAFLFDHPVAAARLGSAGRRRAAELFGLERCVDAYERLYRRLASPGRDATRRPRISGA
jgi:glycogen(starch) synthase